MEVKINILFRKERKPHTFLPMVFALIAQTSAEIFLVVIAASF